MKKLMLIVSLAGFCSLLLAQNTLDGIWLHKTSSGGVDFYFVIENNALTHIVSDGESGEISMTEKMDPETYDFVTQFQQNKNSGVYSWTNSCDGCGWTESQIYHLSYLSEDKLYYHFHRIVNNIDASASGGEDCFEEGKCFDTETSGYLVRHEEKLQYGAKSSDYFEPIAYRTSTYYSELDVEISTGSSSYSCTLHAPGTTKAFFLRDNNGNTYKLKGEEGFGGFGSKSFSANESERFTLQFEKVPSYIKTISLVEGSCTSGCWHVYDIKIN